MLLSLINNTKRDIFHSRLSLILLDSLVLPIIEDLKKVSLRHWRVLDNIVGSTISEKNFELLLLFDPDIIEKRKRIQEISEQKSPN